MNIDMRIMGIVKIAHMHRQNAWFESDIVKEITLSMRP